MATDLVAGDTLPPLDLTVSPIPDGYLLADATLTVGARPHGGGTVLTASATALDTTTVRVARSALPMGEGVWSLEVQAVWADGNIRSWPDGQPAIVRVRPQIVEA